MTPSYSPLDANVPPPTYSEALNYPKDSQQTCISTVQRKNRINIFHKNTDLSPDLDLKVNPGEVVYLCKPSQTYYNLGEDSGYQKLNYIYSLRRNSTGKSIVVLEVLPETLASFNNCMPAKTYEKIEVVEGKREKSTSMCVSEGSEAFSMVREPEVFDSAQTNGKSVRMPANGLIYNDKMIVESLLTDVCNLPPPPGQLLESDSDEESETNDTEQNEVDMQLDKDLENLNHALEKNGDDLPIAHEARCVHFEENTPFLSQSETHFSTFRMPNEHIEKRLQSGKGRESENEVHNSYRKPNEAAEHRMQVRQDSDADYADSGYSDSHRPEVKDMHAQNVTEDVIYSEPDRSSSDISIKCDDDATNQTLEKHQRTLKRTNNGAHHTVYDLCPSDSFYNSAENLPTDVKRNSLLSNEQSSKMGPTFSSLTDVNRSRNPLSRDSSVSFYKPSIVHTDKDCYNCRTEQQDESDVRITDVEPLVSSNSKAAISTEALSAQLLLDDSRSYYRRKAADRGTLICAGCGISIVATIVFLLIYFS